MSEVLHIASDVLQDQKCCRGWQ